MLTFALAVEHPEVIGEAPPMAAWLPPQLMPEQPFSEDRRVPIRSAHGTADPVVRYEATRAVVEGLASMGWDAVLVPFEGVEHVMTPEMNAQFERWLEAALSARAPALAGEGLGEPGAESEDYPPFVPLDSETVEAIEAAEEALSADVTEGESDFGDQPPRDVRDPLPAAGG